MDTFSRRKRSWIMAQVIFNGNKSTGENQAYILYFLSADVFRRER